MNDVERRMVAIVDLLRFATPRHTAEDYAWTESLVVLPALGSLPASPLRRVELTVRCAKEGCANAASASTGGRRRICSRLGYGRSAMLGKFAEKDAEDTWKILKGGVPR